VLELIVVFIIARFSAAPCTKRRIDITEQCGEKINDKYDFVWAVPLDAEARIIP
jgi:hypothetical protein